MCLHKLQTDVSLSQANAMYLLLRERFIKIHYTVYTIQKFIYSRYI